MVPSTTVPSLSCKLKARPSGLAAGVRFLIEARVALAETHCDVLLGRSTGTWHLPKRSESPLAHCPECFVLRGTQVNTCAAKPERKAPLQLLTANCFSFSPGWFGSSI